MSCHVKIAVSLHYVNTPVIIVGQKNLKKVYRKIFLYYHLLELPSSYLQVSNIFIHFLSKYIASGLLGLNGQSALSLVVVGLKKEWGRPKMVAINVWVEKETEGHVINTIAQLQNLVRSHEKWNKK